MFYRQLTVATVSLVVILGTIPGMAAQTAVADATPPVAASVSPAAATAATPAAPAASSADGAPVTVSSATAAEAKKVTCRNERVTGSNFRTRKVCTSPNAQDASGNWVRDQQDRGAIGAAAIVNSAGGG